MPETKVSLVLPPALCKAHVSPLHLCGGDEASLSPGICRTEPARFAAVGIVPCLSFSVLGL